MKKEDLNKREKHIRYNFASMFILIAAISIMIIASSIYILKLLMWE